MRNLISKKKLIYPIQPELLAYLEKYGRLYHQQIQYEDLGRYEETIPLYDEHDKNTFWASVLYSQYEMAEIHRELLLTYAILKANGDTSVVEHLFVDRIDICLYGNTLPFRIRIVNKLNDNFDYFYVKNVDANRIYGLELEHILSPNRINYLLNSETIVEEHIVGIPGDAFMKENMPSRQFDQVRLAKEFVKFNERCFVRLLGDMHSGNFVVDLTRDFEKWHYRMRPIDFDQQSYHWRKQVYLPQFFQQNNEIVNLGMKWMSHETVKQYQREEHSNIATRLRVSRARFEALMVVMREDCITKPAHIKKLIEQLSDHYQTDVFDYCQTMGEMVYASLDMLVKDNNVPVTTNLPWM